VRRVIAAIDNSAAARPVLAMAKAIASDLGGELDVLHVVEDGDETARASAEVAGETLRTLSGDPVEQLATVVAEEDVRLWSLEPEVASEAPGLLGTSR